MRALDRKSVTPLGLVFTLLFGKKESAAQGSNRGAFTPFSTLVGGDKARQGI